ncbi:flagellar hook assembly protein FlgD [Rhodoferax saidenbachensis]|uniref:Basal-body rod modification protein FlgD n=1 Tax=Rhodoferax saidenbachensis TaxID=1484693 RepID=A0A1P8K6K6_9BURK|nr:flagellar hook capping FlgD N-terminal domain-containing protein [Rhodoferax saidenbachensis]APW41571.1 flagellar biosynthesis protein FlgD [Rhodoferax saidenbachensis]
MLTSNNNINTADSSNLFGATTTKTAQNAAEEQTERFLKLLVAQLNNQDPMNPMDNAQMTSQMAQINTVSGINQLNETVKTLSSQFTGMQVMQGSSIIGKSVLVKSDTLTILNGKAAGAVDLEGKADKVTVQILTPGGKVVDTIELGAQSEGLTGFSWDASKYTDKAGSPTFKVTATLKGVAVKNTALAHDTVVAVGTKNGSMTVELSGRNAVAYGDIQAIL